MSYVTMHAMVESWGIEPQCKDVIENVYVVCLT